MSTFFPHSEAIHAARKRVSITLRDFAARTALDLTFAGIAEFRYRMELERVLGGAAAVLEALLEYERARSEQSCYSPYTREADVRGAWIRAMDRAMAAAHGGPAPLGTAWFEVKTADVLATSSPRIRRRPSAPSRGLPENVQGSLF